MNIKKMIPAFAIAMGLVLAMATSGFKEVPGETLNYTLYTFKYNPPTGDPDPYSIDNVEEISHWSYAPTQMCQSGNAKACTIKASEVDASDPLNPVLLSSENIDAALSGSGTAYVNSTADATNFNSPNISNRSN